MTLPEYVLAHTERGACRCGKCIDRCPECDGRGEVLDAPGQVLDGPPYWEPCPVCGGKPTEHTVDLYFFLVALTREVSPNAGEFRRLTEAHHGEFTQCNPLDGMEHSYIELGGWIGDQGLAMQYMGLGTLLGVFDLLTPKALLFSKSMQKRLAVQGMITVRLKV